MALLLTKPLKIDPPKLWGIEDKFKILTVEQPIRHTGTPMARAGRSPWRSYFPTEMGQLPRPVALGLAFVVVGLLSGQTFVSGEAVFHHRLHDDQAILNPARSRKEVVDVESAMVSI